MSRSSEAGHLLWDLPVRLFHWSLPPLLLLAWWSAETSRFELHEWVGYTLLVLVGTRILWGFVGSIHARFADFLAGPLRVVAYLREGRVATRGHNPLGGWAVLLMLALLLVQGVSGLFNSDDALFYGPLYYWPEADFRNAMGEVHATAFDVLLGLLVLHIATVSYHQWWRGDGMITAMVRGRAPGRSGLAAPRPWWLALVLAGLLALGLWQLVQQAPAPVSYW